MADGPPAADFASLNFWLMATLCETSSCTLPLASPSPSLPAGRGTEGVGKKKDDRDNFKPILPPPATDSHPQKFNTQHSTLKSQH